MTWLLGMSVLLLLLLLVATVDYRNLLASRSDSKSVKMSPVDSKVLMQAKP